MIRFLTSLSLFLGCSGTAWAADTLDITQGTMEAGGSATMYVTAVDEFVGYGINLAPQFGYFLSDQVELIGSVGLSISSFEDFTTTGISLAPGVQGVFGGDSVRPFVGATLLLTSFSFEDTTITSLGVQVPVGVLVPVSDAVAISIGTNPSVVAPINNDGGPATITVPAGALGVRSFFR